MSSGKPDNKSGFDLSKFPEDKILELKEAFKLFDKDGNEVITIEELGQVLRSLGLFPTQQELDQMLREIDIDGDGTFSFDEFVQLINSMGSLYEISEEEEEKELRAAFKVFDRTGQGFITSNDLRSVLQCLGEQLDQDEIECMIEEVGQYIELRFFLSIPLLIIKVDLDGDGKIDFEEFVASLKAERLLVKTGELDRHF